MLLEARRLSLEGAFAHINLQARRGGILGLFGLVGSGIDELSKALLGVRRPDGGEIVINGLTMVLKSACDGLHAVAGVLPTASLASGQPRIGSSFFIDGLTAVRLGGMVIKFGQPNVLGTLVAVLLLAVLVSGTRSWAGPTGSATSSRACCCWRVS